MIFIHICLKKYKSPVTFIAISDEIIPVDTVLAFVDSNEYAEISLLLVFILSQ